MTGDEMVEKARAATFEKWFDENYYTIDRLARGTARAAYLEGARSAVRDAVRELIPFLEHDYKCHRKGDTCTCGLSALRKKFEVEG